jgi:SAM-dependent methyltransferase
LSSRDRFEKEYWDGEWKSASKEQIEKDLLVEDRSEDLYGGILDRKVLRSKFRSRVPDLVLDAGCGSGMSTKELADRGSTVVLLDLSLDALRLARVLYKDLELESRAHFVLASLTNLPFKRAQFDLVYPQDNIKYFDDPSLALREILGVTKEGGRILLCVPHLFSGATLKAAAVSSLRRLSGREAPKERCFTYGTVSRLVEACGLQIEEVVPEKLGLDFAVSGVSVTWPLRTFLRRMAEKVPRLSLGYALLFVYARRQL